MTDSTKCAATPCHCDGQEAQYIITYKNDEEACVSQHCADMHIMAGYPCRKMKQKGTKEIEGEGKYGLTLEEAITCLSRVQFLMDNGCGVDPYHGNKQLRAGLVLLDELKEIESAAKDQDTLH